MLTVGTIIVLSSFNDVRFNVGTIVPLQTHVNSRSLYRSINKPDQQISVACYATSQRRSTNIPKKSHSFYRVSQCLSLNICAVGISFKSRQGDNWYHQVSYVFARNTKKYRTKRLGDNQHKSRSCLPITVFMYTELENTYWLRDKAMKHWTVPRLSSTPRCIHWHVI